ncbi:hypothetical protein BS17DRAFT_782768 [Gyrodon lividus]|nr:hypothetical protein BS17DRAFT_782768 [Gyrodon lividus]
MPVFGIHTDRTLAPHLKSSRIVQQAYLPSTAKNANSRTGDGVDGGDNSEGRTSWIPIETSAEDEQVSP